MQINTEVLDNLIDESIKERPGVKKYLEEKERIGSPQTRDQREDVVYNHLYTFFSRYYDNGDFIPRRRYSQTERYAVPYNGEEIYLHWANQDQYYVKSGERFSDYRFKTHEITFIFDLRDVDIEKDNVKGAKRFFIPYQQKQNTIQITMRSVSLLNTAHSRMKKRNSTTCSRHRHQSH